MCGVVIVCVYFSDLISVPLVTSQPERVVRLVSDSLRVTSTDRGNQFNRRWKEAKKVDIVNFVTNFSLKSVELVIVL